MPDIQSAMGLAVPGDTVLVEPGDWAAPTDFREGVRMVGAGGPEVTVLTPALFLDRHLEILGGPDSTIEGFTFIDGFPLFATYGGHGGAIFIQNASTTIRRCHFLYNNAGLVPQAATGSTPGVAPDGDDGAQGGSGSPGLHGANGGAIYVEGGTLRIEACRFVSNRAGRGGEGGEGGRGGEGGADTIFTLGPGNGGPGGVGGVGGRGGHGGAIACEAGASVVIVSSVFHSNQSGGGGAGGLGGDGGFGGDAGTLFLPHAQGDGGDGGQGGKGGDGGTLGGATGIGFSVYASTFYGNLLGGPGAGGEGGRGACNIFGICDEGDEGDNGTYGTGVVLVNGNLAALASDEFRGSILWASSPVFPEIATAGSLAVTHSNTDQSYGGIGNIHVDPRFVGAPANLSLGGGSPCIDAGDNTALPSDVYTDVDGNVRFLDDTGVPDTGVPGGGGGDALADIGAHEYGSLAPSLACDVTTISLASGGTQTLALNAGPSFAGEVYWILGSTQQGPGSTPLPGITMPFVFDSYTNITLHGANSYPLVDTLGVLDASGEATAAFTLAPGTSPSLAGFQLTHAYGVVDVDAGQGIFVSNRVPLALIP